MSYNYDYTDACMQTAMQEKVRRPHRVEKTLSVRVVNNAVILPQTTFPVDRIRGGVIGQDGSFVSNTGFHVGKEGAYEYDASQVAKIHKEAVYLGFFNPVWGHCITDNLKLLWFVLTDEYKKLMESGEVELVFSCTTDFHLSHNFGILLGCLGLDIHRLRRVDHLTAFDRLYVPEACFFANGKGERFFTNELESVVNHILSFAPESPAYDKVYLTRTKLPGGLRDMGEKDIEQCFRKMGYKILSPEKLSFFEQLSVLSHCKVLATTEGSISHNALFLSECSKLVIVRKVPFVNEYQLAINEMRRLNVTYIDAHLSVFANVDVPAAGPFFLYVNDNMARFCHMMVKPHFSLSSFKRYATICLMLPNFDRRVKFPDYYYQKLSEEIEKKKSSYRNLLGHLPFLSDKTRGNIIELGKKILAKR